MENLKINIVIAGRSYPLNVKDAQEEEAMRKAAKNISQLVTLYEQNYAVNDKQDVLAMCALQFASQLEIASLDTETTTEEVLEKIKGLNAILDSHLE